MYSSIIRQIDAPLTFNSMMLRKQVALFALKNPVLMLPYVERILIDTPSYEHWVHGIASGQLWGDETVLIAISLMWNVAITVIGYNGLVPIQHTRANADIYLLGNGDITQGDNTHFSGTCKYNLRFTDDDDDDDTFEVCRCILFCDYIIFLYFSVTRTRRGSFWCGGRF